MKTQDVQHPRRDGITNAGRLRAEEPMKIDHATQKLLDAAQRAHDTVIALPDTEASHTDADEALLTSLAELEEPALNALFPGFVLGDATVIANFEFIEARWPRATYLECVADLHANMGPELGAWLRSSAVIDRVCDVAAGQALTIAQIPEVAADLARERYQRLIAAQLVGEERYEPWATILAFKLPELTASGQASREQREAYRRGELERLAAEERAAQDAIAASVQRQRDELAAFFSARSGLQFQVGHRQFTGGSLAAIVRGQAGRDSEGYLSTDHGQESPSLAALDLAMRRTLAAEAVPVNG